MFHSQVDDSLIKQLNIISNNLRQNISKSIDKEFDNQKEQILNSPATQDFEEKNKQKEIDIVNDLLPLNPSLTIQQLKSKFIIPKNIIFYALIKPKGSKKGTRYCLLSTSDMRFIYNSIINEYIPLQDTDQLILEGKYLTINNEINNQQTLYTIKMDRDIFDSIFLSRCSPLLSFILCFISSSKKLPNLNLITLPFYEQTLFQNDFIYAFKYIDSVYSNKEVMNMIFQVSLPNFPTIFEYIFSDFISIYRENIDYNVNSYFKAFSSAIFRNDTILNSSLQTLITETEDPFESYINFIKSAGFNQYTKLSFYIMYKILSKTINAKLPKSLEKEKEEIMSNSIIIILRILYYYGISEIIQNPPQLEKYKEICSLSISLENHKKSQLITSFLPLRYQPKDYQIKEYDFDIYEIYIKIITIISQNENIDLLSSVRKYDKYVEEKAKT